MVMTIFDRANHLGNSVEIKWVKRDRLERIDDDMVDERVVWTWEAINEHIVVHLHILCFFMLSDTTTDAVWFRSIWTPKGDSVNKESLPRGTTSHKRLVQTKPDGERVFETVSFPFWWSIDTWAPCDIIENLESGMSPISRAWKPA